MWNFSSSTLREMSAASMRRRSTRSAAVSHDAAGRGVARSAAKHRSGHQAGAAGISEIEQAADDFA
jgi:hypothetical protein